MKTLETNDWMVMNDIIYKIYTTEDAKRMREQFLEQMKLALNFDSADFYLASQDGAGRLVGPVLYNCEGSRAAVYESQRYFIGMRQRGKCLAYRETDVPEGAGMKPVPRTDTTDGYLHSLHLMLGRRGEFLGLASFYRGIGKDDFTYDDVFLLDSLKEHMAYRLSCDRKRESGMMEKLTATQAAEKYGLTRREQTILRLLLQGKDNPQVCDELIISVNTLKKHILNIYRKLGIRNRVQMFKMIREKE